jgi:hypothetical protein
VKTKCLICITSAFQDSCVKVFNISSNIAVSVSVGPTNQPTRKLTKDGVLRGAQDDDPCSVKPFVRTKLVPGNGEQCLTYKLQLGTRLR